MMNVRWWVPLLTLSLLLSCAPDPGSFSLTLDWQVPPEKPLWVFVQVEERSERTAPGTILSSATPTQYEPGKPFAIAVGGVRNGDQRVVVVEVRDGQDTALPVLYYGISDFFSIEPGKQAKVSVALTLSVPDPDEMGAQATLLFDGQPTAVVGGDAIQAATIRTKTRGAVEVVLANDPAFGANLTEYTLADGEGIDCWGQPDPDGGDPWTSCNVGPWNLLAGLPVTSGIGTYSVYVRFKDQFGYESQVQQLSVTLDIQPPQLLAKAMLTRVTPFLPSQIAQDEVWATPGTELMLSFALSEPLGEPPILDHGGSASLIESNWEERTLFDFPLKAAGEDGPQAVTLTATDLAGNTGVITLGQVHVDSVAPDGLTAERQHSVRLYRAPWGSSATSGDVETQIRVCVDSDGEPWPWCPLDGGFAPGTPLEVYRASEGEQGQFSCGQTLLAAGLAGTGDLARVAMAGDHTAVCLVELDLAGNRSKQSLVQTVEWVATLGGKVPGMTTNNPHAFYSYGHYRGAPEETVGRIELGQESGVAAQDGIALQTEGEGQWEDCTYELSPGPRLGFALAYDRLRGRAALVGGARYEGCNEDSGMYCHWLWEWDGRRWSKSPGQFPGEGVALHGVEVSYHEADAAFVLPGVGMSKGVMDGLGTWVWRNEAWSQVALESPGRPGSLVLYDRARQRTVLLDLEPHFGDDTIYVWEWDGQEWTMVEPEDPEGDGNPIGRSRGAAAYDAVSGTIVLAGGIVLSDGTPIRTTWSWNGRSWRRLDLDSPICIGRNEMVFDEGHDGLLWVCSDVNYHRTWHWADSEWMLLTTSGPMLPGDMQMTYLHHNQTALVVGLAESGAPSGETWVWDGDIWRRADREGPQAVIGGAMTYDTTSSQSLLVGGGDDQVTPNPAGLVWAWDGVGWTLLPGLAPADGPQPGVYGHAIAGSPEGHVWLYGGKNPDGTLVSGLWRWDGAHWSLEPLTPGADSPGHRQGAALVYDAKRQRLVLYGGRCFESSGGVCPSGEDPVVTWEWDGELWHQADDGQNGPSPRVGATLTYLPDSAATMLLGGRLAPTPVADALWLWDGETWYEGPHDPLSEMAEHDAALDAGVGRVLAMLGCVPAEAEWDQCQSQARLQEWNGTGWYVLSEDDGPTARQNPAITYDAERDRVVLFGGGTKIGASGDTWEWERGRYASAAHLFSARVSAAGYARLPQILALEGSIVAGATGYPDGTPEHGVQVLVWQGGRFRPVGTGGASVTSPEPTGFALLDNPGHIPLGPGAMAYVLALPSAPNGLANGLTGIATDYVELTTRFRLRTDGEVDCWDQNDDDWDGTVDCLDSDCANESGCQPQKEASCKDGLDNDADGAIDCLDRDCWCRPVCQMPESGCCQGQVHMVCVGEVTPQQDCAASGLRCGVVADGDVGCGPSPAPPGYAGLCPGEPCEPACDGKECGGDGCGGSCGGCLETQWCDGGTCACQESCIGKLCGDDGCGGSCGVCPDGETCMAGECVCEGDNCTGPCGLITSVGCCNGADVMYCFDGGLGGYPCFEGMVCSWVAEMGYYDCGPEALEEPSGTHPIDCEQLLP